MAAGTFTYPGGSNTYVKNHQATGKLTIAYSRNPEEFPLANYAQYRKVDQDSGYYLQIDAENAARIVGGNLNEFVWPDGADRPRRNSGTERFRFLDYKTERYDFDFTLGDKARKQADWDIEKTEAAFHAQQAMTGRTVAVVNAIQTTGNWDSNHTADLSSSDLGGRITGQWNLSTTARLDIKKSLNYALNQIRKSTLGVVRKKHLQLVFNPTTAQEIGETQEIADYLKGSPEAWNQVKGETGKWAEYGLPDKLYGIPIEVEDTVVVTSRRGAATVTRSDAMSNGNAFLLARLGSLVSAAGQGPSFSTAMVFLYEEMTVEARDDRDNRRHEGHVVDDYAAVVTSSISGFFFQNVLA